MTTQPTRRRDQQLQSLVRGVVSVAALAAMIAVSHKAEAALYQFKETEPGMTETFIVGASPVVVLYSLRNDFELGGVSVSRNGVTSTDTLFFGASTQGGGYADAVPVPYVPYVVNDIGPQLYTGAESDPTFVAGTTTGIDLATGQDYVLTIGLAPEPPTLCIFAGAVGLLLAGRRSCDQSLRDRK